MAIGIHLVVPSAQALDLLVSSLGTNQVLRYDGQTGAFIDAFVPAGSGGLRGPRGLVFGPDGNLYVSSVFTNSVLRYHGTTGALILLKSVTITLTGGNVLLNRDSGTPPGVGSERRFPAMQGFADGVLSGGECVNVPYRIGLAETPFEFLVNGVGVASRECLPAASCR